MANRELKLTWVIEVTGGGGVILFPRTSQFNVVVQCAHPIIYKVMGSEYSIVKQCLFFAVCSQRAQCMLLHVSAPGSYHYERFFPNLFGYGSPFDHPHTEIKRDRETDKTLPTLIIQKFPLVCYEYLTCLDEAHTHTHTYI